MVAVALFHFVVVVALEDNIGVEADLLRVGTRCVGRGTEVILIRRKALEGTDSPALLHREGRGGPGLPLVSDPGTGNLLTLRGAMRLLAVTVGTSSLFLKCAAAASTFGASVALHTAVIGLGMT